MAGVEVKGAIPQTPRDVLVHSIRADMQLAGMRLSEHTVPDAVITGEAIGDRALLLTQLHAAPEIADPRKPTLQRTHHGHSYTYTEEDARVHGLLVAKHVSYDAVEDNVAPDTFLLASEAVLHGFFPGRGDTAVTALTYKNGKETVDVITVASPAQRGAFIGHIPWDGAYKKQFADVFGLHTKKK